MGDIRDAKKDASEGILTIPVLLGARNKVNYVYPLFLAFTSFIWWDLSDISIYYLLVVWGIQWLTYNLTPR